MLVLQINWLRAKFGLLMLTCFFMGLAIVLTFIVSFLYEFSTLFRPSQQWIVYIVFSMLWVLRATCVNTTNVSQSILMNNCVDHSLNGAAHGIAGAASSIAWVFAPLLSGSLITGTVKFAKFLYTKHVWLPLVEKIPFAVLTMVAIVSLLFTFSFPASAEHSKKQQSV